MDEQETGPPPAVGEGSHRFDLIIVAALGLLLALWLFGPALADLQGRIVGHDYSEQYVGAWANQVALENLARHQRSLLQVDGVVSPRGGVIYPMSLTTVLLSLPFYPFWDAAGVFNLAMVLNFLLALVAAFALLRHVGGGRWAALPGALLFALSPVCLEQFAHGPVESTALGWIPLALLAVEKLPGNRLRQHLVRGALLAATFAASPYYGLFAALAAAYLMLTRPGLGLPARVRRAGLTLAVAGVLTLPMAWALQSSISHPRSMVPKRTAPRDMTWHEQYLKRYSVIDLASLALPTRAFNPSHLPQAVYIGLPALLLGGLGLLRVRRSRRWAWLGGAALLFSLGGALKLGGYFLQVGEDPLPMPAYWLCRYVPPFSDLFYPARALPVALLALGVMITLLLSRGLPARARSWALAAAVLLLAADMLLLSPGHGPLPSAPYRVPTFYRQLAQQAAGSFGVVDLPAPSSDSEMGRYFLYQLSHRKRIPYNLDLGDLEPFSPGASPAARRLVAGLALAEQVPHRPRDRARDARLFRCPESCDGVAAVHALGYRYFVLHRTGHGPLDQALRRCLGRCLRAPVHADARVTVFETRPR